MKTGARLKVWQPHTFSRSEHGKPDATSVREMLVKETEGMFEILFTLNIMLNLRPDSAPAKSRRVFNVETPRPHAINAASAP